jgi:hypothetical protein
MGKRIINILLFSCFILFCFLLFCLYSHRVLFHIVK